MCVAGGTDVGTIDFTLCNHIESIETYYSDMPGSAALQRNERQRLTIRLQTHGNMRAVSMWVSAGNTATTNVAAAGDDFRCVSKSADATRDAVGTVLAFNAIAGVTAYKQLIVALRDASPEVTSELDCRVKVKGTFFVGAASFEAGKAIATAADDVQAYNVRSYNWLTGHFAGYFLLQFTDEMGDTWTTEAIEVSSANVHSPVSPYTKGPCAAPLQDAATPAAYTAAGLTAKGCTMPADSAVAGYGDFVSTAGAYVGNVAPAAYTAAASDTPNSMEVTADNFNLQMSDKFSGNNVARRIEAALEALPNGVVTDVQVEYEFNPSGFAAQGSGGVVEKQFSISFISNSGDIPALEVGYHFVDDPVTPTITTTPPPPAAGTEVRVYTNGFCRGNKAGGSGTGCGENGKMDLLDTTNPQLSRAAITDNSPRGSTENVECSNRGLCDYEYGLCDCFFGFAGDSCSIQDVTLLEA